MRWFKHDSDAHNDAKLEKVLMRYGAEGYALYWYCIELIAGKVSSDNITFELEHDAEILAWRLKIDSLRVSEIMAYLCDLDLFNRSSTGVVTCMKLAKRLDERWTRNADLKEVIKKCSHTMSEDSLKTMTRLLPLEEKRREEKRIKKGNGAKAPTLKRNGFKPPTHKEVAARVDEMDYCHTDIDDFINFYESKNWMVGKNKMAKWESSLARWDSKNKKDGKEVVNNNNPLRGYL